MQKASFSDNEYFQVSSFIDSVPTHELIHFYMNAVNYFVSFSGLSNGLTFLKIQVIRRSTRNVTQIPTHQNQTSNTTTVDEKV